MNDSQKLIVAKKILLGFDGLGRAEIVEGQAIFVKNNKINEIGPTSVLRQKYKEVPEIGGKFICNAWLGKRASSFGRHTFSTRSSGSPTGTLVR